MERVRHELSAVKAGQHSVFDKLVVARVASCILNESRVDRFSARPWTSVAQVIVERQLI